MKVRRIGAGVLGSLGAAALASAALAQSAPAPQPDAKRGEYMLHAGSCIACHTDKETLKAGGPILGGGRALPTPFGTFYSPNITAHRETGIGTWSDADFIRAFREGRSPAGHNYYPAFPYTSFTGMTDRDLVDLKAYIFSLPPVARASRSHDLDFPYGWRFSLTFWKWLNFEEGPFRPDPAKPAQWNRGAYLVNHVGHCGECHTPRDFLGARKESMQLAGTGEGPDNAVVPNITPDQETGIGKWSEQDVITLLKDGVTPEADVVGGSMSEVVNYGTSKLSDEDLRAIAAYLRSLKPIRNKVEKKK